MDEMFDRFFQDRPWFRTGDSRGWAPAVDMVDRNDEVVIRMDVPGLTEKDLDVTVDSGMLTVHGERKDELGAGPAYVLFNNTAMWDDAGRFRRLLEESRAS